MQIGCTAVFFRERVIFPLCIPMSRLRRGRFTDTVGQYTGFDDKNGTKVFEGDILRLKRHLYVIEWKNGCLYASQKNFLKGNVSARYLLIEGLVKDGAEVIGNIYESPELLEG